ncbi:MAG: GGDEF domain-containing protein [Deltaproteobacteria bacterium]|nr:GGDEF domain-containing protein [Deltaproteobacteria bacterium]
MPYILHNLLAIDIRSLVAVLFWGNLVAASLVFAFLRLTGFSRSYNHTRYYLAGKIFQASAFLLLFSRGCVPDVLSVNAGNTFLFIGFHLEARCALQVIHADDPAVRRICTGITACCALLFNIGELLHPGDPAFRVVVASLCVFLTLLVPTERLLRVPQVSRFTRAVGVFYLVFLAMLLPRAASALWTPFGLLSNTVVQSTTFLSLVLLLIFSLAAYLFLLKEESDTALFMLATTDPLTGLPNKRAFLAAAQRAFTLHAQTDAPLAVIAFELDDYKTINDTWGQNFGELFLKSFATALKRTTRHTGILGRYGDGEFLAVLPGTDANTARRSGEQVLACLRKIFLEQQSGFIVTASGGVIAGIPRGGGSLEEDIRRANQALYIAQTTGGNRITQWRQA